MDTQSDHDFWVCLDDTRAGEWESVLGPDRGRRLPVTSPIPCLAQLPGFDIPQRVFLLALPVMTPQELMSIAKKLAEKFGLTKDEALLEIHKAGIPIREEHIDAVIVHRPQRWF